MTSTDYVLVDHNELLRFTTEALIAAGTNPEGAAEMAGQIVESDLAGHESHGVRRLAQYVDRAKFGVAKPNAKIIIDIDNGSTVRIDGQEGFGHIVMREATSILIERTKQYGVAAVAVRNCDFAGRFSHFGEQAAQAGIVALFFVNDSGSEKDVAPPGGTEGRIATNPFGAGIPRAGGPNIVVDMATSTLAMGRLSDARERDIEIENDWLTKSGHITTAGGVKGFALSVVSEALAGALTSAGTVNEVIPEARQGVFVIGVDIEKFRSLESFAAEVNSFATYLNETPVEAGSNPVQMPGEGSAKRITQRQQSGIPLHPVIWERMAKLASELAITPPSKLG